MKNYIGFANDHSGSMAGLAKAALSDYNTNVTAVKDAATREMLDTIVSVVGLGVDRGDGIKRQIVNSNPHVLRPMDKWEANGSGTPLYDAIGDMIELFKSMPDYSNQDVSFLLMATTDGEENSSRRYNQQQLSRMIQDLNKDGRWTFVIRVPKGYSRKVSNLGIPAGNIQEWETTTAGLKASTAATTAAVDTFYAARSAGVKSSGVFYANAASVSQADVKAALVDISAELNVWSVLPEEDGNEIKPFAEKRLNGPLLKGAAFYQLTKTEARVQDNKVIMIRDKSTGRVYKGDAARQMIGLPLVGTVRLKVGDHGNYDIFIQSTSTNRKLVSGSVVLYHAKSGVPFKPEDQPWLLVQAKTPVVSATQATVGITPVVSPAPVVNKSTKGSAGNKKYFTTREDARKAGSVQDAGVQAPKGYRWFVYV